jgi:hypothetical protein
MHRSGTSAITRVLNLLGCALPAELIGAEESNKSGHWESAKVVTLNDRILASAGSKWDDWGTLNEDWASSGVRDEMLASATDLVTEHAALGPLFVLKDPRIARLTDLWLEAMAAAGTETRVVLMVRNPAEVGASLQDRDLMVPSYGMLLWLRHVLDSEFHSRGQVRVVCRYDELLSDWRGLIEKIRTGLGLALPRNSPTVQAEVDGFISPAQWHQREDFHQALQGSQSSAWVAKTFQIMVQWSRDGENPVDYPALDDLRNLLDRSYPAFAPLLQAQSLEGELNSGLGLKKQFEQQVAAVAEAEQAAAEAIRNAEAANQSAQLLVQDAEARADVLKDALDQAQKEVQSQALQIADLAGKLAGAESALIQRREELAQVYTQLRQAEGLASAAGASAASERELRQNLETRLAEASDEIEAAKDKLKEGLRVAQQCSGLEVDVARLTRLLRDETENVLSLQERVKDYDRLSVVLNEQVMAVTLADAARARAEHQVALRCDEIASLTNLLADEHRRQTENESQIADLNSRLAVETGCRATSEKEIASLTDRLAAEQERRAKSENDIVSLTGILADENQQRLAMQTETDWLRKLLHVRQQFPKWWTIMPPPWRQKRENACYLRAGLFDAQAYLEAYPDVAAHGMDPLRHYILHGIAEGRVRPH